MSAIAFAGAFSHPNAIASEPYLRVKDSSGTLALAGVADREIGILAGRIAITDPIASVEPLKPGCIYRVTASEAFAIHAVLYRAASGKVGDTPTGEVWGRAFEAATGDGSQVRAQYLPDSSRKVTEAHTADDTLTVAESGSVHTTVGAAGTVVFTAPPATVGLEYFFRVGAAQELRIDPDGTETIALPSTGVQGAAGKYLTANADGETVHLVCDNAGEWSVYGFTGTWTAEA